MSTVKDLFQNVSETGSHYMAQAGLTVTPALGRASVPRVPQARHADSCLTSELDDYERSTKANGKIRAQTKSM